MAYGKPETNYTVFISAPIINGGLNTQHKLQTKAALAWEQKKLHFSTKKGKGCHILKKLKHGQWDSNKISMSRCFKKNVVTEGNLTLSWNLNIRYELHLQIQEAIYNIKHLKMSENIQTFALYQLVSFLNNKYSQHICLR